MSKEFDFQTVNMVYIFRFINQLFLKYLAFDLFYVFDYFLYCKNTLNYNSDYKQDCTEAYPLRSCAVILVLLESDFNNNISYL